MPRKPPVCSSTSSNNVTVPCKWRRWRARRAVRWQKIAAAVLQSALPRPCSQPSATAPGDRRRARRSRPRRGRYPAGVQDEMRPGWSPTTSQTSPTGRPSSTSSRGWSRCRRSHASSSAKIGSYGSIPARLGMRISRRASRITLCWSDRACSSGLGWSRSVGRVTGAPAGPGRW